MEMVILETAPGVTFQYSKEEAEQYVKDNPDAKIIGPATKAVAAPPETKERTKATTKSATGPTGTAG